MSPSSVEQFQVDLHTPIETGRRHISGARRRIITQLLESDDLFPASRDFIAKNKNKVASLSARQNVGDSLFLIRNDGNLVFRKAGFDEVSFQKRRDFVGSATSQTVISSDHDVVKRTLRGNACDVGDIFIAGLRALRARRVALRPRPAGKLNRPCTEPRGVVRIIQNDLEGQFVEHIQTSRHLKV